jgi:acyl CoA:acetate/3-ketoacid CoA transferase beta subunit
VVEGSVLRIGEKVRITAQLTAMIRGGNIDLAILGAFEVTDKGDIAAHTLARFGGGRAPLVRAGCQAGANADGAKNFAIAGMIELPHIRSTTAARNASSARVGIGSNSDGIRSIAKANGTRSPT